MVTPDKEAILASADGKLSLRLPAGSFNEEVRVDLQILPPPGSTGMKTIKLFDITACATKRKDAPVKSLLKDATITIVNARKELAGTDVQSLKLYYLDNTDLKWKPVASELNASTLTLTATTNHFTRFGELVNPVISGPGLIMNFETDLHSGTSKASYPIELPPGPGGFKPSIELNYDSGRADGMKNRRSLGSWAGIGWSLDTGYISYDDGTGGYCLVIGGVGYEIVRYGDGYYTKPDLFYKIVRDEATGQWEAWDRSGTHYLFGSTSDTRQYYRENLASDKIYYRWDLDQIEDTHKNTANFTYNRYLYENYDSVRSVYPAQISYGKVTVKFESDFDYTHETYGPLRWDDPLGSAVPLPKVMDNRWLDRIDVYVDENVASTMVRRYKFTYNTDSDPDKKSTSSTDYGGIYYSGKHKLLSVQQFGTDGTTSLPALSFSYQDKEIYYYDIMTNPYIGNPSNPTSIWWPYLTQVTNGYGATVTFTYTQKPDRETPGIWTRQVVTARTLSPGIGPDQTYTYSYGDTTDTLPEYQGRGWNAGYRGFRRVKETDAGGKYTWHYYYTTGIVDGKDWDRLTGREYKTEVYDPAASPTLLQTTTNTWNYANSSLWTPTPYTFLDDWDGYGSNQGWFNYPHCIAADGSGNIYVSNSQDLWVQKFSSSGSFVSLWQGYYLEAEGLAYTSSGNGMVYATDSDYGNLYRYNTGGIYKGHSGGLSYIVDGVATSPAGEYVYVSAGNTTASEVRKLDGVGTQLDYWYGDPWNFSWAAGACTDSNGHVYIAEINGNRITELTSTGQIWGERFYGDPTSTFNGPYGVAVDSSGNMYVADTGNHRIQAYTSTRQFKWKTGKVDGSGNPISGDGNGEFNHPEGVAIYGNYLFITDSNNHRVQKLALSNGDFDSKWGFFRYWDGWFWKPMDVAMAATGNTVWVVDQDLHEVRQFDIYGNHNPATDIRIGGVGTPPYGSGDGQFYQPNGLGISRQDGTIIVADTENHRIQTFTSTGQFKWKQGKTGGGYGSGNGEFKWPMDAAWWDGVSTGNIYVADCGNGRIQKFYTSGEYVTQWSGSEEGGPFSYPRGVAAFADGSVVVADTNNHCIQAFTSTGQFKWKRPDTDSPAKSSANGWFDNPWKVEVDSSDNVWVVDQGNHRVQEFTSTGQFINKFGAKGTGGGAFKDPSGVAVSPSGDNIFVADTTNKRIQKFAPLWEVKLEQTDVTMGSKTARTRYSYDNMGNMLALFKDGDTGVSTDNSTVWRAFTTNTSSPNWILDRVARERVYAEDKSTDNGTGSTFKLETRYFRDGHSNYTDPPITGDITKLEKYDPGPASTTITYLKAYDSWGNLTSEREASKSSTNYTYDNTHHAYMLTKTLPSVGGAPAMSESYTWDYVGGRLTSETDANGQVSTYQYDTFWRPVKLIRPGDSEASPTIQHEYPTTSTANPPNIYGVWGQQHIKTTQKVDASTSNDLWTRRYFDGLGRVIQVQSNGETGKTIVTTATFSDRGLTDKEYVQQELVSTSLSGYSTPNDAWKKSSYQYDGLKRVTGKTNPDGTTISHAYTDWQDEVTNERGKKKTYYNDAFARLWKVEEKDDSFAVYATTVYAYDFADNLVKVTDNAGNETLSTYNGFSRKVSMKDPDMGEWSYVYDAEGNLISQTDGKGQAVTFEYDEINRLKNKKSSGNTLAGYTYDSTSTGNMGKLKRTGMSDATGTMAYKYDSRGRLIEEKRSTGNDSYTTGYSYDSADRLLTVTYPTGETATQTYNGRGLPYSLSSSTMQDPIISSTLYNNLALPTDLVFGNNLLKTTYGYWDTGGGYDTTGGYYGKLWEIKTVKVGGSTLQDVKHTWDAIGNLTVRENVVDTEKESFAYDFLDRLTSQNNFLFTFGDTGDASSRVSSPSKAAVDSSGNIQVADMSNCRVAKFNSSGVFQSSFGSSGYGDGQFCALGGITIDSSGNIYTTEWLGNHRVQKFNSSGVFQAKWGEYGSGNGQFNGARDIVYNPVNSYLYVADRSNHRVQYFDTDGVYKGQWGSYGTADGQFNGPWGVGVDSSGNVYVADSSNNRIQKFNSTGTHQATWGSSGSGNGQYSIPRDVAVDSAGNVFIADTGNNRIQKLNSNGTFIMTWGTSGSNPGQFSNPYGVALTSDRIYVVDTSNNRLQTYDLSTTAGWAYNQIGNMTYRDGADYTYGTKPHAVTAAGTKSYAYDANGSMTTWDTKTLTWDVENRLTGVTGGVSYAYDGDGFRVTKTENGETILYVNKYYEKNLTTGLVTLYYYLGDKLVAYKEMNLLRYIHQDHLTGTSLTTSSENGSVVGSIRYKPYGESCSFTGSAPAQKFTGQRLDDIGLYYYGARYYDAGLGRFVSGDTVTQSISNPQFLNRYSYCINNPLKYVDRDGHIVWFAVIAVVLVVVNVASAGYDAYQAYKEPSALNVGFLVLGLVDPSGIPWGAARSGLKQLGRYASKRLLQKATNETAQIARAAIKSGSLGNKEARLWYIGRLKEIPDLINKNLPLEERAKQAFELRNSFKAEARDLMADKNMAELLDIAEPVKTWDALVQDAKAAGRQGDDIYKDIIESSQRSNKGVNQQLGLNEGVDY